MATDATPQFDGRCFVIQPFDHDKFDQRYADVFGPAIRAAGLESYRVDGDPSVDVPIEDIEKGITDSLVCFAEITTDNPNVWYELGFAMASDKPICLVCSTERATPFPFDVRHRNILRYDVRSTSDFNSLSHHITERLKAMLKKRAEIAALSTLRPTTQTEGLTAHEMAAMALIMAEFDQAGVSSFQLKQDMRRAGYTEIAAGIAIEKLRSIEYVESVQVEDERGETYSVWRLTSRGKLWLIHNEDKLSLRTEPKQALKSDDIPF